MKPYEKDHLIDYYIGITNDIDVKLTTILENGARNENDICWIKRIGGMAGTIVAGYILWSVTGGV